MQHTITIHHNIVTPWFTRTIIAVFMMVSLPWTLSAQDIQRERPIWWFGASGAVNLNFYGGTTQNLSTTFSTPAAFHKGFGAGLFLGGLVEYRPNPMWGGTLQLAYDDRRAMFFDVPCPCGENSTLSATPSYISIEPTLRLAPFSDAFYIFAGPRVGFNFSFSSPDERTFVFTQGTNIAVKSQFSGMNDMVFSGLIGVGYDYALTMPNNETQWELSPFISYQPFFGQDPRDDGHWGVSTVRIGTSIKFGSGDVIPQPEPVPVVAERNVPFSVRAPKAVPVKRRVRETFPMRNYVFFEEDSKEIPARYELLTKAEAGNFKEEQLQEVQPKSFEGRPMRQTIVYYNILNVIGDRMKRSPKITVTLSGSSPDSGAAFGKERAETVKKYLVTIFGIDSARITTEGRELPLIPSTSPRGKKELSLLQEGDRRVEIVSSSDELMLQVGGPSRKVLKPVQIIAEVEDPLDSHIIFTAAGAHETFASWSLEITDDKGKIQRIGPSTKDQVTVSGNTILGERSKGTYTVTMLAETKQGKFVRKETTVQLVRRVTPPNDAVRFRILFDFDQSTAVSSYEEFLTKVVAPQIPDSGIVIIHGYTDIIGEEEYNQKLSDERVNEVRRIIQNAVSSSDKKGVTFETFGFGEDVQYASFDNSYPEGRFYNRSVIIDIVPE